VSILPKAIAIQQKVTRFVQSVDEYRRTAKPESKSPVRYAPFNETGRSKERSREKSRERSREKSRERSRETQSGPARLRPLGRLKEGPLNPRKILSLSAPEQ
jgi:hypothetical protein